MRQDPVSGYWVALSKERSARPLDFVPSATRAHRDGVCPFCPGNEQLTPPAVLVYPQQHGSSWRLRVFANKYPALREDAGGIHEVIVDSWEHADSFGNLPEAAAVDLLLAARDRMVAFRREPGIAYSQLFKNNGAGSGASQAHPHSQLIAMPEVPPQIRLELQGARSYFERQGSCPFCATPAPERLIALDDGAIVLAPYAPRVPFETWILPRTHDSHFEAASEESIRAVGLAMHRTVRQLGNILRLPDFNLVLHTAPTREDPIAYYHWHIEILPRTTGIGGFELGTNCYINAVFPEDSAALLRL